MKTWNWRRPFAVLMLALSPALAAAEERPLLPSHEGRSAGYATASNDRGAAVVTSHGHGRTGIAGAGHSGAAYLFDGGRSPFEEETPLAPLPDRPQPSPSDLPPTPRTTPEPRPLPIDEGTHPRGESAFTPHGMAAGSCGVCAVCRGHAGAAPGGGGPRRLLENRFLNGRNIEVGGWIAQGITGNSRNPADRFNGPVTFNDRAWEYQLNQLWLFAERKTDTRLGDFDVGGRIDVVYGTDHRFTTSHGLENDWNRSERFYGVALPQLYMDVAYRDLKVRMGHYFTTIGYEAVPAPENFFYSHAYTHQYGEPFTHTGILASYELGDRLTFHAGADRGWDSWESNNEDWAFLGGVDWTSRSRRTNVAFALHSGNFDDAGLFNRTIYSLVASQRLSGRMRYVIQHDWGLDNYGAGRADDRWYGINQYLFYDLTETWTLGARIEWFRDRTGSRVAGLGADDGGRTGWGGRAGFAGDFQQLTLGANWKPSRNLILRPEIRYDWYHGSTNVDGLLPYVDGTRRDQLTGGFDLIVLF